MLIYHPAQDANHCVYRTLLILEHSVHENIDVELYRLLDFYVLFPHLLKLIRPLPAELRSYRSLLVKIQEPYESMLNAKRILLELEPLQTVAIHNLLAKNLIDIDNYRTKQLKRTSVPLPAELKSAIYLSTQADEEWFRMIVNELPAVDFGGKKGLKMRTGLMEYRYDMDLK